MARAAVACLISLLLLPAFALAAQPVAKPPWATINVCDTAKHPDAIGIRAAMQGDSRKGVKLLMRFRVQWHDPADGKWHNLLTGGDSGFVRVGSGKAGRQSGQIFRYQPPAAGKSQLLRGAVQFRWMLKGKITRHASRITRAGHTSSAGSDPKGYSAATCTLTGS